MTAVAILPCIQYMTGVGRVAATVELQQRVAAHVAATVATTTRSLQRFPPCICPNTDVNAIKIGHCGILVRY